jgi:signal transduction histidine kinase
MPVFQLDAGQIKTCFLNILTNAIQAMPRGGEVHITTQNIAGSGGAEFLQLRFADTGPGIPPQDREKVFTPFYSTKATGFGLGLAITRKIVEDHGGRVFVTGGDGPGTVVVMELPLPGLGIRGTGYGTRDTGNGTRDSGLGAKTNSEF